MSESGVSLPNLAFFGLMGSGKSTLAELCVEHLGYHRISFAGLHPGGLRDLATRLWGEEALNDRGKLQKLGMAVRAVDEDAFVGALLRHLETNDETGAAAAPWVLDDLRFPNEAWGLKELSFQVVRVTAGRNTRLARLQANGKLQDEKQLNHPSETAMLAWPDDWRIRNSDPTPTHSELLHEVGRIISHGS